MFYKNYLRNKMKLIKKLNLWSIKITYKKITIYIKSLKNYNVSKKMKL